MCTGKVKSGSDRFECALEGGAESGEVEERGYNLCLPILKKRARTVDVNYG